MTADSDGPRVEIAEKLVSEGSAAGEWYVVWRVENRGDAPILLTAIWLPHGRFRSPRQEFLPPLLVEPGGEMMIVCTAVCREEPGESFENAFIVLTALWQGEAWRILARLGVAVGERGEPYAETRLITVQPVGFSTSSDS